MKLLAALLLATLTTPLHDIHVSNTRMAVQGRAAYLRVRLFHDDFTAALREYSRRPGFELAITPQSDSVVMSYLQSRLTLKDRGQILKATLIGSGEEKGMTPELNIWYFDLRFDGTRDVKELEIRNELLFDQFKDQRNIVKALLPTKKERTIFLVPGEGTYKLKW